MFSIPRRIHTKPGHTIQPISKSDLHGKHHSNGGHRLVKKKKIYIYIVNKTTTNHENTGIHHPMRDTFLLIRTRLLVTTEQTNSTNTKGDRKAHPRIRTPIRWTTTGGRTPQTNVKWHQNNPVSLWTIKSGIL